MKILLLTILLLTASIGVTKDTQAQPFDHSHAAFTALLKKHVVVLEGGKASQVRYAELVADRAPLRRYLDTLAAVKEADFNTWTPAQRFAFLVNTYNAATLELMVQHYPVKSIKDIGSIFDNRWKRKFIKLFGSDFSLDMIEHDTLRKPGAYNEVRVHFAVNCASIGCPALREEAFVAERLDQQLEEQAVRFLSDRSRNRFVNGQLDVSMIFNWFVEDWTRGYTGVDGRTLAIKSRAEYFGRYANVLGDSAADRQLIGAGKFSISNLHYDWAINDKK